MQIVNCSGGRGHGCGLLAVLFFGCSVSTLTVIPIVFGALPTTFLSSNPIDSLALRLMRESLSDPHLNRTLPNVAAGSQHLVAFIITGAIYLWRSMVYDKFGHGNGDRQLSAASQGEATARAESLEVALYACSVATRL